jgi:hypothetical protein
MSRKTRGRSYLQQLAQPVSPGETVLTARPGVATETGPVVPLIEDHFDMPARTVFTPGPARSRSERPAMNQELPTPVIESMDRPAGRDAIAQHPTNAPARVAASGPKPHRADAEHQEPLRPAASAIDGVSADSPHVGARRPNTHVRREESFVVQQMREETRSSIADLKKPEHQRMPHSSRAEEGQAQPLSEPRAALRTKPGTQPEPIRDPVLEKPAAKNATPSQFARQDYFTERTAIRPAIEGGPATRAAQQKGKPEVQADAGPRVHIGTVEIRMALPQPPPPPPAVTAPSPVQNNGATHARGRSGPAEQLARGLEWSYGLVQG